MDLNEGLCRKVFIIGCALRVNETLMLPTNKIMGRAGTHKVLYEVKEKYRLTVKLYLCTVRWFDADYFILVMYR